MWIEQADGNFSVLHEDCPNTKQYAGDSDAASLLHESSVGSSQAQMSLSYGGEQVGRQAFSGSKGWHLIKPGLGTARARCSTTSLPYLRYFETRSTRA